MSHREFMAMVEGSNEKRLDGYRQTRMLMFTMVKVWAEKGPKTPEELWPLPGDEGKELKEDEKKALMERFAKLPKIGR